MVRSERSRRSRRLVVRHALLLSAGVIAAGAWGCALVAGVDFESARFDPLTEYDGGGRFFYEGGRVETLPDGGSCPAGQKVCSGACVAKNDPAYGCGTAECTPCSLSHTLGSACGPNGECIPKGCETGYDNCDGDPANGCEADLSRKETCGSCGTVCVVGTFCAPAGCVTDCPAPLVPCNGACVDTQTSITNCGGCGTPCPGAANADPTCAAGACRIACRAGFADCANNPPQACAALPKWYVDGDNDNYGTAAFVSACAQPGGHVAASGDCLDSNPAVHPNAGASSAAFAGPNGPSFDYDCSGTEVEVDAPVHFAGNCGPACDQRGYDPLPPRAGAGVNDYCGSPLQHICFYFGGCNSISYDAGVFINCK